MAKVRARAGTAGMGDHHLRFAGYVPGQGPSSFTVPGTGGFLPEHLQQFAAEEEMARVHGTPHT